jgi:hypothetical protein
MRSFFAQPAAPHSFTCEPTGLPSLRLSLQIIIFCWTCRKLRKHWSNHLELASPPTLRVVRRSAPRLVPVIRASPITTDLLNAMKIDLYDGSYWKSYDFASDTGNQSLLERPLGPGNGSAQFQHNGGEIIWNLPNGLQGYMLVDAKGTRINTGPPDIVNDRTSIEGTKVLNGFSCIKCHVNGMLPVADEVHDRLEAAPASYPADLLESGVNFSGFCKKQPENEIPATFFAAVDEILKYSHPIISRFEPVAQV